MVALRPRSSGPRERSRARRRARAFGGPASPRGRQREWRRPGPWQRRRPPRPVRSGRCRRRPATPNTSPARTSQTDVVEQAAARGIGHGDAIEPEQGRAETAPGRRPPDRGRPERRPVRPSRGRCRASLTSAVACVAMLRAVAHHGDPVGDRFHFAQLVGDEEDGAAAGAQFADRPRSGHRLRGGVSTAVGSSRMRISRIEGERLEDLDALALADRKPPTPARRRSRSKSIARDQCGACCRIAARSVKNRPRTGWRPRNRFSATVIEGTRREVLMHHADAEPGCRDRIG